jgi:RNA polymerase primary sigma factor
MDRFITDEAIETEEEVEERLLTERIGRALETLQPRDAKVLRCTSGWRAGASTRSRRSATSSA